MILHPDPQVLAYLERAAREVESYPPWMRCLEASSRAFNEYPRIRSSTKSNCSEDLR